MSDLATMLWKEFAEFLGNRRSLRVFAIAVGIFGLLPTLGAARHIPPPVRDVVLPMYVLVACAIVVAQTAPDLVLRERTGHSLEYLLASRLSDGAIFGGKARAALQQALSPWKQRLQTIVNDGLVDAEGKALALCIDANLCWPALWNFVVKIALNGPNPHHYPHLDPRVLWWRQPPRCCAPQPL